MPQLNLSFSPAFVPDTYLTISEPAESLLKEKGSKFLGFAFPVTTEADIKQHLEILRKKYYDATHHCYAYMLGKDRNAYRANDDGEPNGTAGMPILNQIKSKQLTNILVVVVRYFGGTKLGAAGLVTAYKTTTAQTLNAANIVEQLHCLPIRLQFDYLQMNDIMKVCKDYDLPISEQDFQETCSLRLSVRESLWANLIEVFRKIGATVS